MPHTLFTQVRYAKAGTSARALLRQGESMPPTPDKQACYAKGRTLVRPPQRQGKSMPPTPDKQARHAKGRTPVRPFALKLDTRSFKNYLALHKSDLNSQRIAHSEVFHFLGMWNFDKVTTGILVNWSLFFCTRRLDHDAPALSA